MPPMRPVLFELFGVPIFGYGIMLGLSCVLGAHLAVYLGERSGIPAKRMWWYCAVVILVGIVGGRVHELLVLGKLSFAELFRLQHSGRTAYGASCRRPWRRPSWRRRSRSPSGGSPMPRRRPWRWGWA